MLNALTSLAITLFDIQTRLGFTAVNISGVFMLGTYLGEPLFRLANLVNRAMGLVLNFRDGLRTFYEETRGSSGAGAILNNLIYWADRIIGFISNPAPVITNIIRSSYNYIEYMWTNTYAFIFPHVVKLLDTHLPWWRYLPSTVLDWLSQWLYDFQTFRHDPVRWVVNRLRSFSGVLSTFLSDPDGWLRERVQMYFPVLHQFLLSPSDYIIDRFAERLEIFADRNMTRIIKVAERIISLIF